MVANAGTTINQQLSTSRIQQNGGRIAAENTAKTNGQGAIMEAFNKPSLNTDTVAGLQRAVQIPLDVAFAAPGGVPRPAPLQAEIVSESGVAGKITRREPGAAPGKQPTNCPAPNRRSPPAADNYRGRYRADRHAQGLPPLPGDYDVHHRISQKYMDHPKLMDFDFHQPSNLQGVKGGNYAKQGQNVHSRMTNDWEQFGRLNPNASATQIADFADQIDVKYANDWFK